MWYLCWIALLQVVAPGGTQAKSGAEQEPPATSTAPTYDTGPLRFEITAMADIRFWYLEPQPNYRKSALQLQLRLAGERIAEIARHGNPIFTEAVDDTGQALIRPDTYTQEERTTTRPLSQPPDRLRTTGLVLMAQLDSPHRAARTAKLRGSARLIFAKDPQEITIDRPLQYVGKNIENERLAELGVAIRVVPAEDVAAEGEVPTPNRFYVLHYAKGQERVNSATFYDGWMKPIRTRERPVATKQNEPAVGLAVMGGELNDDSQLVLQVFPNIEEVAVPIEVDALQLP